VKQRISESKEQEKLYEMNNEIMRYKGRLCIGYNGEWRAKLLSEIHDVGLGGHFGVLGTYQKVKKYFTGQN
jgi:hypothetical protein